MSITVARRTVLLLGALLPQTHAQDCSCYGDFSWCSLHSVCCNNAWSCFTYCMYCGDGPAPCKTEPACTHPPGPVPICEKGWPTFDTPAELAKSPWGAYLSDLYGVTPPAAAFPLATSAWWMLYGALIAKHQVSLPASVGRCPPPDCQLNLIGLDNAYSPKDSQWIWQYASPTRGHHPMASTRTIHLCGLLSSRLPVSCSSPHGGESATLQGVRRWHVGRGGERLQTFGAIYSHALSKCAIFLPMHHTYPNKCTTT